VTGNPFANSGACALFGALRSVPRLAELVIGQNAVGDQALLKLGEV
jgi:hypothetical protein